MPYGQKSLYELLAKLKEPRLEYHARLRFRGSGFAFQMKPRIRILCSFVIENLHMSCQLFKAIRPAAVAAIYFFRDLQVW